MKIGKRLAELLYPMNARCLACGDLSGAEAHGLCSACLGELSRNRAEITKRTCPGCMAPLERDGSCRTCERMGDRIERAAFAFRYEGAAGALVRAFKYGGVGVLADYMAELMLESPQARDLIDGCDRMVCVPMDWIRRNRRGYNQAQLLMEALSRKTGKDCGNPLKKKPFTRHQARLGYEGRIGNLRGAISCAGDVSGKRVLLIDDVRTTGSTAAVCADALLAAGAESVSLLTFCASVRWSAGARSGEPSERS